MLSTTHLSRLGVLFDRSPAYGYGDTVGLVTISLGGKATAGDSGGGGGGSAPIFGHAFIDMNLAELVQATHSSSVAAFETPAGDAVSASILTARSALGLTEVLGAVPRNYSGHAGLDDPSSLWRLYLQQVLPTQLFTPPRNTSQWFVASTGALRYDLFAGNITADDLWAISPFDDRMLVAPSIPATAVKSLLSTLNDGIYREAARPQGTSAWSLRSAAAAGAALPQYVGTELASGPERYDVLFADFDSAAVVSAIGKLVGNETPVPVRQLNTTDTALWMSWARGQQRLVS
jgi:hypothetical protein